MTENPRVLQKIQKELDQVFGSERMPTADDFEKLPYTRAVMTEVGGSRWLSNALSNLRVDPEMAARCTRRRSSPTDPG